MTVEAANAEGVLPESNKSKKRKRAAAAEAKAGRSKAGNRLVGNLTEKTESKVDSATLRRTLRIRCTGSDIPDVLATFEHFPSLPSEVLANLRAMGVNAPTPIQMQASSIIHENRDLLACAPTGSGKTLAFLLPLLLRSLEPKVSEKAKPNAPRAVVLEPTRELARQVYTEAGKIQRGLQWPVSLLGDEKSQDEAEDADGAGLLVTTPLRLVYAVKQGEVDLSQ